MQLTIDLILLAIFGAMAFVGWRRGFIRTVLSLARLAVSFLLTTALGPTVADWIDRTFVYPPVYETVHAKFTEIAAEVAATAQGGVDALIQKIPEALKGHLDLEGIDPATDIHMLADEWSISVSGSISSPISRVIGYILLFSITFILLTLAIKVIVKIVDHIRLVHTVDKLLGLALGCISGCVTVLLISAILGAILSVTGQSALVESSFVLRLFAGAREMLFP